MRLLLLYVYIHVPNKSPGCKKDVIKQSRIIKYVAICLVRTSTDIELRTNG